MVFVVFLVNIKAFIILFIDKIFDTGDQFHSPNALIELAKDLVVIRQFFNKSKAMEIEYFPFWLYPDFIT